VAAAQAKFNRIFLKNLPIRIFDSAKKFVHLSNSSLVYLRGWRGDRSNYGLIPLCNDGDPSKTKT
jgi:hypothetical protein